MAGGREERWRRRGLWAARYGLGAVALWALVSLGMSRWWAYGVSLRGVGETRVAYGALWVTVEVSENPAALGPMGPNGARLNWATDHRGPLPTLMIRRVDTREGRFIPWRLFTWWPSAALVSYGAWSGRAVFVPLWMVMAAAGPLAGAAWWLHARERRRAGAGACVGCGYALAGLAPGAVCPECGRARG